MQYVFVAVYYDYVLKGLDIWLLFYLVTS